MIKKWTTEAYTTERTNDIEIIKKIKKLAYRRCEKYGFTEA